MAIHHTPLIIGNWKMNPPTASSAIALAKSAAAAGKKYTKVKVVIAPPLLYVEAIRKVLARSAVGLGVQHTHPGPVGAFTGEVSPALCAQYGVTYAIVGHSERRALGESDVQVAAQVAMILKHRMIPVICIGERERDAQANFYSFIEKQLTAALLGIPKSRYKDVVIAYEPIWAIGTGLTATPEDVQEMKLFIIKVLTKLADRSAAGSVTILYGGSVKGDTAASLYHQGTVHGFLVGGASLVATEFTTIISSTLTTK